MGTIRPIDEILPAHATLEGAGVRLKRAFGYPEAPRFDPFLLLDEFRSDRPADYLRGFPWHPHRGIETITYVLTGRIEHGDSLGNTGVIVAGDVQWMTAGSGIIHQEMPAGTEDGRLWGFQLWINLPASTKMTAPQYREITADRIPAVMHGSVTVRVVCGEMDGIRGPICDVVRSPTFLDVEVPPGETFTHRVLRGHAAMAYIMDGGGSFTSRDRHVACSELVAFGAGDLVQATAGELGLRFLLLAGRPIREPIAWYGPIVMNTEEELKAAFTQYREGTFLRHAPLEPRV